MAERRADQAAGLRRLLAPRGPLVVSLASAQTHAGHAWTVLNLADALRLTGADVLVVDAASGAPGGLTGTTADSAALFDVLCAGRKLDEALLCGPEGIPVLPARAAGSAWLAAGLLPEEASLRMAERLSIYDLIVVNLPGQAAATRVAPALLGAQRLLGIGVDGDAVRAAQQWLRAEAGDGPSVRLLVQGAADMRSAQRVRERVAGGLGLAQGQTLLPAGFIPGDAHWRDAASQGRTVVRSQPAAPAAQAFRRLADTLTRLRPGAARVSLSSDVPGTSRALALTA